MIPLIFAHQAITVFSKFDPIITLGLSLLIPTIIVESLILTNYSKKSWWKLFNFCVIISFIASLAAILLGSFANNSPHGIVVLLCWVALLIIIIWVENIICKKHWEVVQKKKLLQALITINIIAYFIFTASISLIISSCVKGERINRIRCIGNLKQIGSGLAMYAHDHKDFLPNKSGFKGFEQLRSNTYPDNSNHYQCHSCNTEKREYHAREKITKESVDYVYRSGLKLNHDKETDYSKIPVAWDKPTNHEDYGNVVFMDGHVSGFEGKDWMEQAGIKKTAKMLK